MIKRIIFDIDNTLIINKKEFVNYYRSLFEDNSMERVLKLNAIIDEYDDIEDIYSEEQLLKFINKKMNTNYDISFVKKIIQLVGETWISKIDTSVFEYLSKKYELYALTNWFTAAQVNRLKKSGIYKYFTKVIGADMVNKKPNKEAYLMASNNLNMDECVFIGDNPPKDLDIPYEMGARVIFFNTENKYDRDYETINDLKQLKDIL